MLYDVIIIGNGPAGLTAAIYGMRAGLKTLVLSDNPMSGGQIATTYEVDNYPGLPKISGMELGDKFEEHAKALGAEFRQASVSSIEDHGDTKVVVTDKENLETKTVVISIGADHSKLGVPGEKELTGMGVSYCATCDGAFFRNKVAVVNGGGDVAVEDAIFLARGCSKVYLVHRRDELRAAKILQDELLSLPNVEVVWDSVVEEVKGDNKVTSIVVKNVKSGDKKEIETDALFVAIGIHPLTESFAGLADMDETGYILAGEDGATSTPGIFVAGDSRKKRLRQIVTAVADGANAVTAVQDFLVGKSK